MREVRWQRKSCPERSRTGRMGCQPVVFGKQQGRRRVQRSASNDQCGNRRVPRLRSVIRYSISGIAVPRIRDFGVERWMLGVER